MSDEVIIGGYDQAFLSTQSNKIKVSLQYLKKEIRYKISTIWYYRF